MATWYVRPDTSHSGTRNGTSYATAWGGWSEITWGVGGVVAGDILYVCGAWYPTGAALNVGVHNGTLANKVIISGGYGADPGSLNFANGGNWYLGLARANTELQDLTIRANSQAVCIFSNVSGVTVRRCTLVAGGGSGIWHLDSGTSGLAQNDITLAASDLSGNCGSGQSGAFRWRVTANPASPLTLSRVTITGNTFHGLSVPRSVICIWSEPTANAASIPSDIIVDDNTFSENNGIQVEVAGHTESTLSSTTYGNATGLKARNNTFRSCTTNSAGLGGCINIIGFDVSQSAGFGSNEISGNQAYGVHGAGGLVDVLKGSYNIHSNYCDGLTTDTIDACGVLLDYDCRNSIVRSNEFRNLCYEQAASLNYGHGILMLDGISNRAYGNVIVNCQQGLSFGDASLTAQSGLAAYNNTAINCKNNGVYLHTSADLTGVTVNNNILTADAACAGYSVRDNTASAWALENYNCFYGFASGASNHTLGAQSITSDPLLDASYRLGAASPCLNAGTMIDGVVLKDFYGKDIVASPDIGAMQVYAARSAIASRSAITRSSITRNQSGDRAPYG